jgi:thiamine biosynthesis lipoprotein
MVVGIALAIAALVSGRPGEGPELRRFEAVETHMGSPFQVTFYTSDDAAARRGFRAAFDRIAALDKSFSDYDPESELMQLCDHSGDPPVKVSDDLFDILSRSKVMAERTGGAFDPTIAPVVRLWRRARREKKLPDPEAIREALGRVGYQKITLDPSAKTVRLEPGVKLDLGAIAKGYASHEAVKALKTLGITRSLVAGAGDVAAGDPPPGQAGWRVGIAPLEAPGSGKIEKFLSLKNASVSTSGDAERFVEIGGVRYSHVVDPRTGVGLNGRRSATVVAHDGATADALDTAASILGPKRGRELVCRFPGAEMLMVLKTDAGVERAESPGFAAWLAPEAPASVGNPDR